MNLWGLMAQLWRCIRQVALHQILNCLLLPNSQVFEQLFSNNQCYYDNKVKWDPDNYVAVKFVSRNFSVPLHPFEACKFFGLFQF